MTDKADKADKKTEAPAAEAVPVIFDSVDDMLAGEDVEYAIVPAWKRADGSPGFVRIASLSAGDLIEFSEANEGPAKRTANLRIIIKSLVDSKGNRIGDMKQLEAFRKRNAKITNKIVDAILKLNGLGKEAEAAAKNASGETGTDGSPTGSPSESVH